MFDFLRKRLNKTIKDASDSIPEEELEQENTENNVEEQETMDKGESTEKVEESKQDSSDESIDESSDEKTEDKEEENEKEESEDKKENKSRFGFLHRNKDKKDSDKEEKEEESESSEEPVKDKKESVEEEESSDDKEKIIETSKEPIENKEEEKENKKENKSHFGFLHRNKDKDNSEKEEKEEDNKDEDEDKDDEEDSLKYEGEQEGGTFSFITKKTISEDDIDDILEDLELSLIEGDVAFDVADKIVESMKEDLVGRKIKRRGDMELFTTNALKKAITEIIDNGSYDLLADIEASKQKGEPYKIMFVGINGTGKTTTIAKLARYLEKNGYSSVFGASDTFRAGAIEQLEHHANNLNMKIIKHERNSDPAAVAYDAVEHARATHKDVVLIDTSGRMQTNVNLMDEMKKIKRVSKPDIVIYVGDALMGNDATEQATKFNEVIDIDGIILTKADADAKGGAALSIGHVIHKPILFIGTGQSYDDLMEFKPEWMINQIFDEEDEA
ncbi:signal recognition particle-docking protein FtsY [Methanosphaera sp.]|uniref:signal recognition particle-docking protein FtsY n=1 Tax=Methanosphaera sp. TaxID=2666342 RepID=UPI003D91B3D9